MNGEWSLDGEEEILEFAKHILDLFTVGGYSPEDEPSLILRIEDFFEEVKK